MSRDRERSAVFLAYCLLAFAPLTWGGNLVVGRTLAGAVDPTTINVARWGCAAVLLALFCGGSFWRHRAGLWRERRLILALGLSGLGCFHLLQYTALAHTTVLNVAVLSAMTPLYTVLIAWAISGDRIDRWQALGLALSILGAILIVTRGELAALVQLKAAMGDVLQIAAIFFWALYTVLLRYRPRDIPNLPFLLATILPGLALSLTTYTIREFNLVWSPEVGIGLAYLVLFPSVLAYIAWSAGVRVLGPQAGGVFTNLVPIYGAVLAILFLGEPLRPYHLAAAALVAVGIWLVSRPPATEPLRGEA